MNRDYEVHEREILWKQWQIWLHRSKYRQFSGDLRGIVRRFLTETDTRKQNRKMQGEVECSHQVEDSRFPACRDLNGMLLIFVNFN